MDGAQKYNQSDLPADIFNSTNGDIKNYNGQQVKVGVNNDGTRTLTPVLSNPGNSSNVQGYLNDYHNLVAQAADDFKKPMQSDEEIMNNVKSALIPNQPIPQAPNLLQTWQSLRSDPNVTNLESKLSDLKDQENTIRTQTQMSQSVEEGKPVAMNVIEGRQTEEQRQADIQLTSIAWQKQAVTDELNMRYTMIDNIMKFTQQDYDNALKSYTTEFQQNQAVFDAFNKVEQQQQQQKIDQFKTLIQATGTEVDMAQKQAEFQYQQQQDIMRNASANLTIMANMIKGGNLNYNQLSADQKLNIQKMEVQAGLGTGFLSKVVQDNANGKVVYTGKNGVVMQMPDGSLKTVNVDLGGGGGSGSGETTNQARGDLKQATADMTAKLKQVADAGSNGGHVPPAVWQQAVSAWNSAGLNTADFNKNFQHFADPNRGDFEQAYGFKNYKPQPKSGSAPLNL